MLVIVLRNLMRFFTKRSFYHQGFFAVKRWRRDYVVGGMETRFQCRKAHNPSAKCEAFHIAPRLFFMFLFFIPFTIRQQSIIYPRIFFLTRVMCVVVWKNGRHFRLGEMPPLLILNPDFGDLSVGCCACYFATFTAVPLERRKM